MEKLVAVGRIEAGAESYDPGTCLPDSWSEATKNRLIQLGAAVMRSVTEEDIAASVPVAKPKTETNPDAEKLLALVSNGVVTKEQMDAIVEFWEVKTWEDLTSLTEVELTQTKGVGKATATKILAAIKEG